MVNVLMQCRALVEYRRMRLAILAIVRLVLVLDFDTHLPILQFSPAKMRSDDLAVTALTWRLLLSFCDLHSHKSS